MKATLFTTLATLAGAAMASPVEVVTRADVTEAQFKNFQLFAQYSAAAFCNNENPAGQKVQCGGNWCPTVEAANVTTHSTFIGAFTDARGLIALDHTNKFIVVSYRGTVSARNWITDLVFPQIPCDLTLGCLVHTGFLAAWGELRSRSIDGLRSAVAAYPKYQVVITGHSLGGAVATIAAGYLRKAGFKADLYTYGSPRVGNSVFVKYVTNQAGAEYRVTHETDPISRLPPIIFNFRHTSPEYWLREPTASPSDVTVCTGYANIACSAGQTGFDMAQHGDYFEPVNGCEQLPGTPWRTRDVSPAIPVTTRSDISDAELAKQLAQWAQEDMSFAADLVDRA
ncbi:Alpha/Beta hydrolase protein [Podospora aff. communis PSN243]|uniref:Alpha/Beta hydrolase protein n=1 Tax=Podospora aff. communis PSN243 TaxID=3040156 RepID=A0AAV9GLT4_9PEZI|nr:Alpha/Beta hydrolase protein [Podospora aff. communis PSN243]